MKKLLYLFFALGLLISCGAPTDPSPYSFELTAEDGDGTKKEITFKIQKQIIDSLGIKKNDLILMGITATNYADWDVKNKSTYSYDSNGLNFISLLTTDEKTTITFSVMGSSKNSFGVEGNLTTFTEFNLETLKLIRDENEMPIVLTSEF